MGKFLDTEKNNQVLFKQSSPSLSTEARFDGVYKEKPRPFCLPLDCAMENLPPAIRENAVNFFAAHKIKWHDGQNGNPSNHLCDSQVCCVNFLFPFADQPLALKELLRPIFPGVDEMLPVEDGKYVSFEWIGERNYLGEKISRNGKRSRGANFTSADAIVRFRDLYGKVHVLLIEWKYTESYSPVFLAIAKSGTSRVAIYQPLYDAVDSPIDKSKVPGFETLFFEPFYQFMRQQMLANEMEKAKELDADIVSVLHIAPAHNHDFKRITSEKLKALGKTATGVWTTVVKNNRFLSVSTEELFGLDRLEKLPGINTHIEYLSTRYRTIFFYE